MKKTFEFSVDDDRYILTSQNPNEQKEPFVISKNEMQFKTNLFYEFVFSDITEEMEVEIIDKSRGDDKAAKRVYSIISEILNGVMKKINGKCFANYIQ